MKLKTMLSHYGEDREKNRGAVVPPIYQNSLFTFEGWDTIDKAFDDPYNNNIYTRGNNPSVTVVEEKIAKMCGGERAKLFASGMGAISSSILHFVKYGDHVISIKNVYGPTNNFLNSYLREKMDVETTFISGEGIEEFEEAVRENTSLIYLESPSSAVFSMQDIRKVAEFAKARGIKTIIDNTWATPLYQKPLEMGIDLEVHSCSKYLGGHSDIVSGVVAGREKDIKAIYETEHALLGAKMAPFEGWLLMRSLRTLPYRLKGHEENAMVVADFLEGHPKVSKVLYPGLESHPQYELGRRQMKGSTGLMAFELKTDKLEEIKNFVDSLKYFSLGVSWGGHESLVYVPAISYLKELPKEQFEALGISLGTIRISVGLEDSSDLVKDLAEALENIQ